MHRRRFLSLASGLAFPAFIRSPRQMPQLNQGLQIGDPLTNRAIVWARSDRASRMIVDYATTESFGGSRRVVGPTVDETSDFTGRLDLGNLRAGQKIFVRVHFEDRDGRTRSNYVQGAFRTAPSTPRDIRFLWSADTAGQGYGINPDVGGMRIYETMRGLDPDFFIHSGDTIYADNPIPREVSLPDGRVWRNITTEAKSKVAETVGEFRGNYLYNLMDENVRRFNAAVPQIWQWDDHEVINNWSPGLNLQNDKRYQVKDVRVLAERARRAFLEYAPIRFEAGLPRVYRRIPYGPLLDVFVLDMRSYRAANSFNRQEQESAETAFLGNEQWTWLDRDLRNSRAVWKIIASDMPIGLIVGDGQDAEKRPRFENSANGNGPALGRELEIARLLRSMRRNRVKNVVWLTGDVHYTAAHSYDPAKAQFTDFDPFWEFVAGPLNAGTFGPNGLDNTFGPEVVYQKFPQGTNPDRSPFGGMQFFGEVFIDGTMRTLRVNLRDLNGEILFSKILAPL